MQSPAEVYLSQLNQNNSIRTTLRQSLLLLSLAVTLVVFWGLKLTGITMAGEAFCGIAEHSHSEECPTRTLICGQEESEAHMHTEDCIVRNLICTEPEVPSHAHSKECLAKTVVCTQEEGPGHTHDDTCIRKELICKTAEEAAHFHDASCYSNTLTCPLTEVVPHFHDAGCYTTDAVCGQEESELHTHQDSCMHTYLSCTLAETSGHAHTNSCYESLLTCLLEETPGHIHDETCYQALSEYICGQAEYPAHTHEDSCYQYEEGNYICMLEETEGHTHEDSCYEPGIGFGCGLSEADGHIHTPACITPETQFGCEKEICDGHSHTDSCYDILEVCPLEEHIHDESCYSDVHADIETSDDWDRILSELVQTGTTAENLVTLAQSQLGYTESTRNFQVDAQGIRRGITRYGQWYGNPYGSWSSMFVSFCLHYAGAEDLPANAGAESMRLEWNNSGLYQAANQWTPQSGNLVFLHEMVQAQTSDTDVAGQEDAPTLSYANVATAVAIITEVTPEGITVIQGDWEDSVSLRTLDLTNPAILGYGLVPEYSSFALRATDTEMLAYVASTVPYSTNMFTAGKCFVLYMEKDGVYYAIDGNANAVPVLIEDGRIYSDAADPNRLLWTFTHNYNNYYSIANASTGLYLHPYQNSPQDNGILLDHSQGTPLTASGTGVKLIHSASVRINADATAFDVTTNQGEASTFYFGEAEYCSVWLDGTDGNLNSLSGSPNQQYDVLISSQLTLPEQWESPTKYSYRLRGWYDVTHNQYYAPGEEVTITENTVFYADWIAATYDIGQYNAHVANTVSTNSFITTHLFDYNYLFNVLSANATGSISKESHAETWNIIQSGTVGYKDRSSINFIFLDYGDGGALDYPNNRLDGQNAFPGEGIVTGGIYNSAIGNALFSTNDHLPGKCYLGTGDHLFQIMNDPNDPYYGYYYYDSARNAASYNQSDRRFYVYDYLEATSAELTSVKSDFLPLNSPYANTNGQQLGTYVPNSEHARLTNYVYDAKYDGDGNSVNRVSTNYAFGMKMDIRFYLPNKPGEGGNLDLYGNEMRFTFSGDDDLWVLVDGRIALDIGGIHQAESGEINFSTGDVSVQGNRNATLSSVISTLEPGEHTLTVMYLERGASHSNCAIYFNLAPRFGLNIQKEDVLTQKLLDGTQFSIYEDAACTVPAKLWKSQEAYDQGVAATHVFTIENGTADIWGLGSGNTYYIRETGAPDAEGYGCANGIIRLTIGQEGIVTYNADIIADPDGKQPSKGFTVHGVKIDNETKTAYIVVTNAPETVTETTTVQVIKKWEDTQSHSSDYITAYLKVTDPDGTVRRIREVILSDENDWHYTWTNLPKYDYDAMTIVNYGIEESYESGYYSSVRQVTEIVISKTEWAEALSFQNGETYILRTDNGYLATRNGDADTGYMWLDEATAKATPYSLWTAAVTGGTVKLTNGIGQTITFYYNGGSGATDFFATSDPPNQQSVQNLSYDNVSGGLRIFYQQGNTRYYLLNSMNSSGKFAYNTNGTNALIFHPVKMITQTDIHDIADWAYQIVNAPLPKENETAFSVQKVWRIPDGYDATLYEQEQVTVRLLADGVNSGRTVTLNLKNGWSGSFQGLPYKNADGKVIQYSVQEVWKKTGWTTDCGEVITTDGSPPTYSATITNTFHPYGPPLPSTGTAARSMYELSGLAIMLGSLAYGFGSRRKRERRTK